MKNGQTKFRVHRGLTENLLYLCVLPPPPEQGLICGAVADLGETLFGSPEPRAAALVSCRSYGSLVREEQLKILHD